MNRKLTEYEQSICDKLDAEFKEQEELKEFHKTCQDEHGMITEPFAVWKLAKQHLLNSQKPKCEVFETMGGSFRVTLHNTRNTLFLTPESMDAALKWAERNGYQRVVCD